MRKHDKENALRSPDRAILHMYMAKIYHRSDGLELHSWPEFLNQDFWTSINAVKTTQDGCESARQGGREGEGHHRYQQRSIRGMAADTRLAKST